MGMRVLIACVRQWSSTPTPPQRSTRRDGHGLGVSDAVNALIRRGLIRRPPPSVFRQETRQLGLKIDVSNVAETLELLQDGDSR